MGFANVRAGTKYSSTESAFNTAHSVPILAQAKFITCGLRATELAALIDPNATKPIRANSSAWLPIKLVRPATRARAVCLLLIATLISRP